MRTSHLLVRDANDAFERYLHLQGQRFAEAAAQLDRLRQSLQKLDAASPDEATSQARYRAVRGRLQASTDSL
jgi:hypothetical protein